MLLDAGCGPFNQDVPGTAMGFWLTTPTPENPRPRNQRIPDENQTLWLFATDDTPLAHRITVGTAVTGLERGQYRFTYRDSGRVNRRWDEVTPDEVYCVELQRQTSFASFEEIPQASVLVEVSADGMMMTIQAISSGMCEGEAFSFSGTEQTFYR